jgi:vacuolar-type H+-ATPase subunit E/Vma4
VNLDAVRDALLSDARQEVDEALAAAERDAAATVTAAREEANRTLDAARADGEAEARTVSLTELARSRRRARELVLSARRAVYERALAEVCAAATRLRDSPDYDAVIDGLSRLARSQLGDGAVVTIDDEVGGVIARAGTRTVDYRLPVIAERCFDAIGSDVESLWQ